MLSVLKDYEHGIMYAHSICCLTAGFSLGPVRSMTRSILRRRGDTISLSMEAKSSGALTSPGLQT